jgi:glycosyltransferase involved in cell wall biosynthesis
MIKIVVPCFNESLRLDFQEFRDLLEFENLNIIFVDDSSNDNTLELLKNFRKKVLKA